MRTLLSVIVLLAAIGQAQPPKPRSMRFDLQIHYDRSAPLTAAQEWAQALQQAGFEDVRLSAATGSVKPHIEAHDDQVRVVGVIGRDKRLTVPELTISVGQAGRLRSHLERLVAKETPADQEKQDLDAAWRKQLAAPVTVTTRGRPLGETLTDLIAPLLLPVAMDPTERRLLLTDLQTIDNELKGLSLGTSLAILLQGEGLALVVDDSGGAARARIVPADAASNAWPLGRSDRRPDRQLVPKLLDLVPVQVEKTPLPSLLEALEARLETPMLLDHAALAESEIVPAKIRVTLPEGKSLYKKVLEQALFQARLRAELRVDDAGRPFFWIRPLVRAERSTNSQGGLE